MKKRFHLALLLALAAPMWALAQSNPYLQRSFEQTLNFENLNALLASEQFQMLLWVVAAVAAIVWIAYLWGSLTMAYNRDEIDLFRRGRSRSRTFSLPKGIPRDPDMPHASVWGEGRLGLAPHIVLIDYEAEENAETEERDQRAEPNRRGEQH